MDKRDQKRLWLFSDHMAQETLYENALWDLPGHRRNNAKGIRDGGRHGC